MKFLAKTLELSQGSRDSLYAPLSAIETSAALQCIQTEFEQTGPIREIAIDNGWGAEFLLLAAEVDKITS